jgi:hypothetical protein
MLTETMTSPTQLALLEEVRAQLPEMTWVSYQPINRDNVLKARDWRLAARYSSGLSFQSRQRGGFARLRFSARRTGTRRV